MSHHCYDTDCKCDECFSDYVEAMNSLMREDEYDEYVAYMEQSMGEGEFLKYLNNWEKYAPKMLGPEEKIKVEGTVDYAIAFDFYHFPAMSYELAH